MNYEEYQKMIKQEDTPKTFTYKTNGKKWELPISVLSGYSKYYYEILGYRTPKAGEHYLSGCKGFEEMYYTKNDLTTKYLIVHPLKRCRG